MRSELFGTNLSLPGTDRFALQDPEECSGSRSTGR